MNWFKRENRDSEGKYAKKWSWKVKGYIGLVILTGIVAGCHFFVEPWIDRSIEEAKKVRAALTNEIVAYADTTEVKYIEVDSALLSRIADCESGSRKSDGTAITNSAKQFDSKGNVVKNHNKNGSTDLGKYQINFDVWGMKAMEKGFNLFEEKGNYEMAKYIFTNRGTGDWYSSESCWKR